MSHRIVGINLPLDIIQNESMIQFLKTNGFVTLLKYCERTIEKHKDDFVNVLLSKGYIVAVANSDELNLSIGVSRKGLVEYHKAFEKLKMAKVYSTSFGYVVILGRFKNNIERFFIGNSEFYDSEISKIEEIKEDVSEGNVSLGNTEYNISSKVPNNIPEVRRVKKVKKLKKKVEEKEEPKKKGILEQIEKANQKSKKEKEEYDSAIEKRKESIQNPSKKKVYKQYKSKEISDWGCEDFLGYYLNKFVDMMGMEDIDFINHSRSKTKLLLMNMGKFKNMYFPKSNEDFRNYIDWAMQYINDPNSWIDSAVSIYSIVFNNLSKKLVKEYFVQRTKNKVVGRLKMDDEYSDEEFWKKKYLNEK